MNYYYLLRLLVLSFSPLFSWSKIIIKNIFGSLVGRSLPYHCVPPQSSSDPKSSHIKSVICDSYSNMTVRGLWNLTWKDRNPRPGTSWSVAGDFKGHKNLIALQSYSPLSPTQTSEMLLWYVAPYLHIKWKASGSTISSSFREVYCTPDNTASKMLA